MPVIDAHEPSALPSHVFDVCVVGAGAAGITVARTLGRSGLRVLLLESGGLKMDPAIQGLYQLDEVGYPLRRDYHSRARFFGGSCNLWAGRNMLLGEEDFAGRHWLPNSDWPIRAGELANWYPEACRILGIPGPEGFMPSTAGQQFSAAEQMLFSHPSLQPTVSLWAKSPARPGRDALAEFRRSANITLLLNASALTLSREQGSPRVASIDASTLDGRRIHIRARYFVLACGGLETPRLMMLSTDWEGGGAGNASGLLGRFFMDHPRAVFGKFLPNRQAVLRALLGRALPDGRLQVGLRLSPEVQAQHRLPNHYVTFEPESSNYASESYQALAQAAKLASGTATSAPATSLPELIYLLSPRELIPHFAYRAIQAARDVTSRPGRHKRFMVVYFCEQLPLSESRVQLGDARDALGQRRLQLDWKLDDTFVKSLLRTQEILATTLAETGIGTLQPGVGEPRFTDASHHMGTTRMSSHPAHGVVDPDCRVHGIPNLFVAGSSIFPSGGHANPTLTIVALALRLADHLAGELTKSVNLH